MLELSPAVIYVTDREGRYLFVNRAWEQVTRISCADALGKTVFDVHPREAAEAMVHHREEALASGPVEREEIVPLDDGPHLFLSLKFPLNGAGGQAVAMAGISVDLTLRQRHLDTLMQRVAEAIPHAFYVYDLRRSAIVHANHIAFEFLPPGAEHYRGEQLRDLVHEDDVEEVARRFAEMAADREGRIVEVEYRLRDRKGEWRWIYSRNAVFQRAGDGAVEQIVGTAQDITVRKLEEQKLRDSEAALQVSSDQLRGLAQRLLQSEEEERKALSRELHDELNQQLAVIAVEIDSLARDRRATREKLRRELKSLERRVAELCDDVRRMAHQLRPSVLDDLGLEAALRSYCDDFSRREGLPVRFVSRGIPAAASGETALALYRVAQEALRNAAKHAGLTRVEVRLGGRAGRVWLFIRDFGAGFDPGAPRRHGLGIISMQERMNLVGGRFHLRSRPGKGTRLAACAPVR